MAASTEAEKEKYDTVETIGKGSFGIIHKVKRRSDNQIFCRKEINYLKMSQKEREQLHAEFSILSSLRHPNIVAYLHREHIKASQELHLYMEYCGGGDLGKVIKNLQAKNQYAEEEYVWSIFSQLVTALYRCHYGVDPPEVGKSVMGPANNTKPSGLRSKSQIMILHRDLKPENVFLGEDNSVKLGDFGLSKLMQSHDFASTYVGTPFYMSPEICAAERYTLHSDVWSLGCIMYELCARHPPFNAKTHFHLVQKIKEGRVDPLPRMYSAELRDVIMSCLKTNPLNRPDTASLLQLPVVRLMRKEREVVEFGRVLKVKEEQASALIAEMEARIAKSDSEREKMRSDIRIEIESAVRREWEVKARLEIDRQVQIENERLRQLSEHDFQSRVRIEVQKQLGSLHASRNSSESPDGLPYSSVSTFADTDYPSTADSSVLTLDTPLSQHLNAFPVKKSSRTPFTRARTQYDSPMDVQMVDPSPMSIASLSLSPRRAAAVLPGAKNIFAAAAEQKTKWQPHTLSSSICEELLDEEEGDDLPDLPSPTRPSRAAAGGAIDPFKPTRPGLLRQKTAPMQRLHSQALPSLFTINPTSAKFNDTPLVEETQTSPRADPRAPKPISPNRRLSKAPSTFDAGSPILRRAPPKPPVTKGKEEMLRAVMRKNLLDTNATTSRVHNPNNGNGSAKELLGGRTLVELSQATAITNAFPSRNTENEQPLMGDGGMKMAARMVDRERSSEREPTTWDPERDEMPSPFIVRGRKLSGVELRR